MTHGGRLTVATEHGLPFYLTALLALAIASSSIVMFEPAPCDLLFAFCLPLLLVTGRLTLVRPVNALIYIGLFLLLTGNLLSLPFAHDPAHALSFLAITTYLVVFWFVFVTLVGRYGEPLVKLILKAYQFAACLTAAIGVLARVHLIPHAEVFMRDASGMRVKSTFKDPNVFGPFLVGAVVLTLSDVLVTGRVKLRHALCLLLYFSGILFTFSRGAFLHLFVSVLAFAGLHLILRSGDGRIARLLTRMVPLAGAGLVAGVVALQTTDLTDYFVDRLAFQEYDGDRFTEHARVMSTAAVEPLGIGPGQWNKSRYDQGVHNTYLRVWVENGLLGLIGFLTFLFGWLMASWHRVKRRGAYAHYYVACLAVVAGVLIESMVIDTLHWRHFFLFLALPVGLAAHEQAKRSQKVEQACGRNEA